MIYQASQYISRSAAVVFTDDSEMKACASGYNHTYLDSHDIDLLSLVIFPSDAQIEALAQEAAEEAESLISILGILPQSLYHPVHHNPLPPISTWYHDEPETESINDDNETECGMPAVTQLIRQFEEPPFFIQALRTQIKASSITSQMQLLLWLWRII